MKHLFHRSASALFSVALGAMLASGCSDDAQPIPPVKVDTSRVVMTFDMESVAGTTPFALDSTITSAAGVQYKVSKLRFFISQLALIDASNTAVPVTMVDQAGQPLPYDLALVDYEKPASTTFRVLAPRGTFRGLAFSVGVPVVNAKGDSLNHADASLQTQPLDVDNDMYWGWNPGYIFLKVEGKSFANDAWQSFFYHVGNDPRLSRVTLDGALTPSADGTARRTLRVDVNKLFVTPSGTNSPDIAGSSTQRMAHSGALVDSVANNVANSGFITLKP